MSKVRFEAGSTVLKNRTYHKAFLILMIVQSLISIEKWRKKYLNSGFLLRRRVAVRSAHVHLCFMKFYTDVNCILSKQV